MTAPTVLSLGQLRAIEFPPQEWVVEDLIPRGGLTGIFGREKIGKSLFISHMGMAVAMDQLFLDRMVTAGPVLFFPVEENLREVQGRLVTLAGKHDPPVYVFPTGGEYDQDVRLDRIESWDRVEVAIKTTRATTAFFDCLREMHGGAENDSDDMSPLLQPMRQFAHDTNTAVVFVHHAGKGGSARGSTAITAACDQVIELTSPSEEDNLTSMRLRIVAYGRYGPRKVLYARLGDNFRWTLTDAPVPFESPSARQRVLDCICKSPESITAEEIGERIGLSKKTVQNHISDLLDQTPARIVANGRGVTGDPRRYHGLHQHLFDDETIPETETPKEKPFREKSESTRPDSSGNTGNSHGNNVVHFPNGSGSNGNHPGMNLCPDCHEPMEAGRRFVCAACTEKANAHANGAPA